MVSVRITAAGAVAVACLSFLTAPVSACDEHYVKKCERASAAAATAATAAAAAAAPAAPAARRKVRRVHVVASIRAKHIRFVKRVQAPRFALRRARGPALASAESRISLPPESALARRFRGFIDPQPLAQNAFETLRKPHIAAVNLEAPAAAPPAEPAATPAPQPPAPEPPVPAQQFAAANAASAPVPPQAFVSETPPLAPPDPQPGRFSIHQLVLALCGALGAASALRFIVGA